MLKPRKTTRKELLLSTAFGVSAYLFVVLVKVMWVWIGANLALRPFTAVRLDFWAALGAVLLMAEVVPKKDRS